MISDRDPTFLSCSNSSISYENTRETKLNTKNFILSLVTFLGLSVQFIVMIPPLIRRHGVMLTLLEVAFFSVSGYYLNTILTRTASKLNCESLTALIDKKFTDSKLIFMTVFGIFIFSNVIMNIIFLTYNITELLIHFLMNESDMTRYACGSISIIICLIIVAGLIPFLFVKDLKEVKKLAVISSFSLVVIIMTVVGVIFNSFFDKTPFEYDPHRHLILINIRCFPESFFFFMSAFTFQGISIEVCNELTENRYSIRKKLFTVLFSFLSVIFLLMIYLGMIEESDSHFQNRYFAKNYFINMILRNEQHKTIFILLNYVFIVSLYFSNVLNMIPIRGFLDDYIYPVMKEKYSILDKEDKRHKRNLKFMVVMAVAAVSVLCLVLHIEDKHFISFLLILTLPFVFFVIPLECYFSTYHISKTTKLYIYMLLSFILNIILVAFFGITFFDPKH